MISVQQDVYKAFNALPVFLTFVVKTAMLYKSVTCLMISFGWSFADTHTDH